MLFIRLGARCKRRAPTRLTRPGCIRFLDVPFQGPLPDHTGTHWRSPAAQAASPGKKLLAPEVSGSGGSVACLQPFLGRFMPEGGLDPLPSLQAPHTRDSQCRVPLFCHLWEGSSLFSQLTDPPTPHSSPPPAPPLHTHTHTSQWQLESKGCKVWAG